MGYTIPYAMLCVIYPLIVPDLAAAGFRAGVGQAARLLREHRRRGHGGRSAGEAKRLPYLMYILVLILAYSDPRAMLTGGGRPRLLGSELLDVAGSTVKCSPRRSVREGGGVEARWDPRSAVCIRLCSV